MWLEELIGRRRILIEIKASKVMRTQRTPRVGAHNWSTKQTRKQKTLGPTVAFFVLPATRTVTWSHSNYFLAGTQVVSVTWRFHNFLLRLSRTPTILITDETFGTNELLASRRSRSWSLLSDDDYQFISTPSISVK